MLISIDHWRASIGILYGHAYALICNLTTLNLNNIELFISYFLPTILFLLLHLHGDINLTLVLRKKSTYFSLSNWNVNSLAAHKKYLYKLHIILSIDMTLFVYQ